MRKAPSLPPQPWPRSPCSPRAARHSVLAPCPNPRGRRLLPPGGVVSRAPRGEGAHGEPRLCRRRAALRGCVPGSPAPRALRPGLVPRT
ncbi:zinc finger protein 318-like [Symphalangus syndactylus]|uniref:zinc finger protein 318-like n=1 Tax=Symphalangus syndactylus TaxID=9590 RepID=UPI0030044841